MVGLDCGRGAHAGPVKVQKDVFLPRDDQIAMQRNHLTVNVRRAALAVVLTSATLRSLLLLQRNGPVFDSQEQNFPTIFNEIFISILYL